MSYLVVTLLRLRLRDHQVAHDAAVEVRGPAMPLGLTSTLWHIIAHMARYRCRDPA